MEFDLRDDGWPDAAVPVTDLFTVDSRSSVGIPIQARFVLESPLIEDSGWRSLELPVSLITELPLPFNSYGHWELTHGSVPFRTVGDWSDIVTNTKSAWFDTDIAGSSTQTELFLIDDFCLGCGGPLSTDRETWGSLKSSYR